MSRIDQLRDDKTVNQDAKRKDLIAWHNRNKAYSKVFDTPDGKVVLEDLLEKSFFFSTTYTGNALTYFREGERNKVLEIASYIPRVMADVLQQRFLRIAQVHEDRINKELLNV
jgi:hypothetical protein